MRMSADEHTFLDPESETTTRGAARRGIASIVTSSEIRFATVCSPRIRLKTKGHLIVRFVFSAEDYLHCRFAISPLGETVQVVRLLAQPSATSGRRGWLERHAATVDALLYSADFAPLLALLPESGYIPDFLTPPPTGPTPTIASELDAVRSTPSKRARAEIERALAARPADEPIRRRLAAGRSPALLADLLQLVWRRLVEPSWPSIHAVLRKDIEHRSRRLTEGGLARLFADFSPATQFRGSELRIRQRTNAVRRLGGRGLLLVPSAFIGPRVASMFEQPWPPSLIYPARGASRLLSSEKPPSQHALARLLGPTRATILELLVDPTSTTAIAQLLGRSPGNIADHLSVLHDANLVTNNRNGRYVIYSLTDLGRTIIRPADRA
jgi:DNA-binding transcriptional ArsR family regulator